MTSKPLLTLIVAIPSTLQNGLLALMTTTPLISAVLVAEEASLVLRMIKDHRPSLIVLDINFPDALKLLNQIKSSWPLIRFILLIESPDQQREVESADAVLIKGFTAEKLFEIIEDLANQGDVDS